MDRGARRRAADHAGARLGRLHLGDLAPSTDPLDRWSGRPDRSGCDPLSRSLLADPATPPSVKRALAGLLAYLVSPLDLVPEFIPGLGQVDDIVVAAIVLRWTGRRVGVDDLRANWSGSEEGFAVLRKLLGL